MHRCVLKGASREVSVALPLPSPSRVQVDSLCAAFSSVQPEDSLDFVRVSGGGLRRGASLGGPRDDVARASRLVGSQSRPWAVRSSVNARRGKRRGSVGWACRGVLAAACMFVVFGSLQLPDGLLVRPTPFVWRFVKSCSVLYLVGVVFLLFQVNSARMHAPCTRRPVAEQANGPGLAVRVHSPAKERESPESGQGMTTQRCAATRRTWKTCAAGFIP